MQTPVYSRYVGVSNANYRFVSTDRTAPSEASIMIEPGNVFVSASWLANHDGPLRIVDVRTERAYRASGHIPGAQNIPIDRFRDPTSVTDGMLPDRAAFEEALGSTGISPTDPILAYDGDRGVNAARFVLTAAVFGHRGPLYVLDGDITTWGASFDLEYGPSGSNTEGYRAAEPTASLVLDRKAVEAAITDEDTLVIDTRTRTEFEHAHIPGAIQLSWEAFVDDDTRRLHAEADLRALLEDRGITPDRRIVLYCNTARRLSHTFAVLAHLEYPDVSFYEGSLTDWVRASAEAWDPIDLARGVREYGPAGIGTVVEQLGDDVLNRLKLVGLYHQKQSGYFMLRTKVPGGVLSARQARVIGAVADEFARAPDTHGGRSQHPIFGDGYLDITTRQDVQMHWIRIEDVPTIWDRYDDVGLTTLQACGNSVRNVVACPAGGVDAAETLDVRPVVDAITERFLGDRTYANLPRKFKISVTGCHENCARAQINDLAFTPATKDGRVGFHVWIGGGLSDGPRMASDLGIFVETDQVIEVVEATADIFIEYGSYLDTAVNRLRYLVEELGVETIRRDLGKRVSFELVSAGQSQTRTYRGDHVGVHPQPDGHRYVGLNVPTGRMGGDEFAAIADIVSRHGGDEIRLTLNQNLIIPHVSIDDLEAVLDTPVVSRYSPTPGPFTRGLVACTGSEYCNFGIIETKARGIRWAEALDRWAEALGIADDLGPVRMHISGCSASCAQPQIADIGIRGEIYRNETTTGEAADIGLGGDLGAGRFISWVAGQLPIEEVPVGIEQLIEAYHAERADDESLAAWIDRQPIDELSRTFRPMPEPGYSEVSHG